MFDDYEVDYAGAADLKKDHFAHARPSFESLKRYTQVMAATPTDTVKRKAIRANLRDPYKRAPNKAQYWPQSSTKPREQLDDLRSWLLTHSSDLPSEIENEKGQTSSRTTYEIPEALVRKAEHDKAKGQAAIFQMGTRTFTVAEQDDFNTEDVVSKYERHGRFHLERSGCLSLIHI